MSSPASRAFLRFASSNAASARAAANAAASSVGKKSATSAAASPAAAPASAPVSLPETFVRRSAPGCKESPQASSHVKEACAPRGSLWEKMFF